MEDKRDKSTVGVEGKQIRQGKEMEKWRNGQIKRGAC